MKLFRILAIAALAMVSSVSAQAGVVVLSNLGANGDDATNVNTFTNQTATQRNAAGFIVGAVDFSLERIGLVLDTTEGSGVSTSLAIYSNATTGQARPGAKMYDSVADTVTSTRKIYDFNFSNATLTAGTQYWVVIETGAGTRWYNMAVPAGAIDPSEQNGSGFSFDRYRQTGTFTSNPPNWTTLSPSLNGYSLAIFGTPAGGEVPEPALTSLLCLGGVALIRRRMKK